MKSIDDMMFEMGSVVQNRTGLPIIILISSKMSNHGPRIKAQNVYSDKIAPVKLFVITIEKEPRVIGNTGFIKTKGYKFYNRIC